MKCIIVFTLFSWSCFLKLSLHFCIFRGMLRSTWVTFSIKSDKEIAIGMLTLSSGAPHRKKWWVHFCLGWTHSVYHLKHYDRNTIMERLSVVGRSYFACYLAILPFRRGFPLSLCWMSKQIPISFEDLADILCFVNHKNGKKKIQISR